MKLLKAASTIIKNSLLQTKTRYYAGFLCFDLLGISLVWGEVALGIKLIWDRLPRRLSPPRNDAG